MVALGQMSKKVLEFVVKALKSSIRNEAFMVSMYARACMRMYARAVMKSPAPAYLPCNRVWHPACRSAVRTSPGVGVVRRLSIDPKTVIQTV